MKILALDSSGLVASVAYLDGEILKAEYSVNHKKTHSQTLMPMLDEICKMAEVDLKEIDAIAIASGPGSFTGLRIGSATVKGLSYALGKPIVEIPTVDALAYRMYGNGGIICPIMDARRSQVYYGLYEFWSGKVKKDKHYLYGAPNASGYSMKVLCEADAIDIEGLCNKLNKMGESVAFVGDGVPVYKDRIEKLLKVDYNFAPPQAAYQSAGCVAALGAIKFAKGEFVSGDEHSPNYLRMSQAERERAEMLNGEK